MEERYKRKSILEQGRPDQNKNKERFSQANVYKAKLRRQKIFSEHRVNIIKESLKQHNFQRNNKKLDNEEINSSECSFEIVEKLECLKSFSDELEYCLENNSDSNKWNEVLQNCAKIIESIRNLLIIDGNSMNDSSEVPIADAFFLNNGIKLLSPFLKFEYFEKSFIEAIWWFASLAQSTSKYASKISEVLPELIEKFINPNEIKGDPSQYLKTIEHVLICLIYIFFYNQELILVFTSKIPLNYISMLVRFRRESLSVISCILINIIIQNYPDKIPDFIRSEMVSDLIYGVKKSYRVAAEVMGIISQISNIKTSLANAFESNSIEESDKIKWDKITDDWIKELVNDERIFNLIRDGMKIQHITVIKPLLEIIGNLINYTEWGIEEELISENQLELKSHFKELISFWFNSQSGVLQRLMLWVVTNMLSSNSK